MRSQLLISLRPEIDLDVSNSTETELFQHNTLRPILKFQNETVLKLFLDFVFSSKIRFSLLSKNQKYEFIRTSVKNDLNLKISLIGITVGLFTDEELDFYFEHKKEINKRIVEMMVKRICDQIEKL